MTNSSSFQVVQRLRILARIICLLYSSAALNPKALISQTVVGVDVVEVDTLKRVFEGGEVDTLKRVFEGGEVDTLKRVFDDEDCSLPELRVFCLC